MLYIKCPTCHRLLGNKEIPFLEEYKRIDSMDISVEEKDAKIKKLMDSLKIYNMCCRGRIKTFVDKIEVIV
jgi:DNA-directed RNA polymerase subunit N (RpoN/RPB10)